MTPKPKHQLAREHLDRALGHIEDDDDQDALNALFYAAEAAVVSLAVSHGIDTKKQHGAKAEAAAALYKRDILDEDFAELLKELNQERKAVWYDGESVDFGERSIEDIARKVESLVDAAERNVNASGG